MGIQTKMTIVLMGAAVLCCLIIGVVVINDMKIQITLAITEKAKSDVATALQIIDYMHPGPWQIKGDLLYKGAVIVNDNNEMVDKIENLTGDTVTIFLADTRVATNVVRDGRRAVGTKAADNVKKAVLDNGRFFLGEAEVVGAKYQTCYAPLRDAEGKIIGMFYVGVAKTVADQLQQTFIAVAVLSARIAFLFVLAATCFIPVDDWAATFINRSSFRWANIQRILRREKK
ncbi:MAG TPA: cache domain-containing protein [Negativicutes bacterium]